MESLQPVAADLKQCVKLPFILNSLGDHAYIHLPADIRDGLQHGKGRGVVRQVTHQAAVDLQHVETGGGKERKVRITRPEIVYRDPETGLFHPLNYIEKILFIV